MNNKTLREEILEYSGIITEASKLTEVRDKIENHLKRGTFSDKSMKKVMEELSDKMKVDIVSDDSLEGTGIPHFKVNLDTLNKGLDEKFVFYSNGE